MRTLGENQFHLLMGTLAIGSLFLDDAARKALPTWTMPRVGLVTLALGLCWVALFAGYRMRNLSLRIKVLEDRLERVDRRADTLEDIERQRRRLPS